MGEIVGAAWGALCPDDRRAGRQSLLRQGTQLSDCENAAGTGNAHVWFDL